MEVPGVINLKGKDYPTYGYILNKAHEAGLVGIATEIYQLEIDIEKQRLFCIVKATVTMETNGVTKVYQAYGDASNKNVNSMIVPHFIRMAETRAKGRALRDAVNIGQTMAEELGEI
jgi:hypothetical protein